MEHFIWSGRRPKIKMGILKKEKSQGGMGLVDIRKRQQTLMYNWIGKAQGSPQCTALAEWFLGTMSKDNIIFKCNLNTKDATKHFNDKGYWGGIVVEWSKLNYQYPQDKTHIENQYICYNSNIKVNEEIIKPKNVEMCKLQIRDVCNSNGEMLEYAEFCKQPVCCKLSWIEYYGIMKAIPPYWLTVLKNNSALNDDCVNFYEIVTESKGPSRKLYKHLNDDRSILIKTGIWWKNHCENFDLQIHLNAFKDIYRITNISKLRNFQF